jgi:molybdate transport system permease protein
VSAHRVGAGLFARVRISPLAALGGLIALYLALPLAAFVIRFLSSRQRGFSVPGLFPSLWMSLSCATISLGLVTVFGVPLAFVLARSTSRWSKIVGVVVQIPLALPPLMSGIVLIYIIGPYTFLGRLFDRELTNSRAGIIIAMTFVAAPFLVVAARAAFVSLDQGMLDVARTLGHSETSRFVHVAVPIAGPSIRAGMLLTWLRAFGEYGAVVVLAYNPTSLPIYTYNQFSGVGLSTTLAPTALAMLVAVVAVIVSRVSWPLRRHHSRVTSFAPVAPRSTNAPDALEKQSIAFHADARVGSFHLEVNHTTVSHLSVLGPSGSGKSLLLRSLAGLHEATYELRCNGETLSERRVSDRPVGYVAQGFSLFPHLTVWQQLLFARHATVELATYWCERLQLGGLEDRFPAQLSGGQRQRVALAQALTNSPRVLLLDEPFSALDSPVRHELQRLVRHLQHETRLSTILVTHDPEEAALLAQDIIVLNEGHALQSGSVREVFTHPASASAARLLGMTNIFEAAVTSDKTLDVAGVIVRTPTSLSAGTRLTCSVRPELVTLERPAPEQRGGDPLDAVTSTQRAVVNDVADIGTAWIVFVTLGDVEIQARGDNTMGLRAGDECDVSFPAGALRTWPAGTEQAERSFTND